MKHVIEIGENNELLINTTALEEMFPDSYGKMSHEERMRLLEEILPQSLQEAEVEE